jgi:hypothetical protein
MPKIRVELLSSLADGTDRQLWLARGAQKEASVAAKM